MIEVEVTYDQSDYVRAIRFISRRQNMVVTGFIVVCAMGIALLLYIEDTADFKWWVMPAMAAVLILLYGLTRGSQSWNISRQLKGAPSARGAHVWQVGNEGIRISGALNNTEMKWPAVVKVRESTKDFFFYEAPRFARFLPKRVLANEQQIVELRRLINEKLGKKAALV